MIGLLLLIITILLIILIVVAVRSSETRVEPFAPYSQDNYANGLYLNKLIVDDLSNDIKINEVGLIDFFLPDGIIVMVKTKDALPGGIQWTQLDGGYYLSNYSTADYTTIIGDKSDVLETNMVKYIDEPPYKIYTETSVGKSFSVERFFRVVDHGEKDTLYYDMQDRSEMFDRRRTITRPEPSSLNMTCFRKEKTTGTCNDVCPKDMVMLSINPSWDGKTIHNCNKCILKTSKNASLNLNEVNGDTWKVPLLTIPWTDAFKAGYYSSADMVTLYLKSDGSTSMDFHYSTISMPNAKDITTYPITYNVNLFVNNTSIVATQTNHNHFDPIDNNYFDGVYMKKSMSIHVPDVKELINMMYPVGTVLLFAIDIDLDKYWAGTKWKKIDNAYLGHDPSTNPGETFGKDFVNPVPTLEVETVKMKKFIWSPSGGHATELHDCYLEKYGDLTIHNHLPRYDIRIYQRIE